MKKFYAFFIFFLLLLVTGFSQTNRVIVEGYVKYSNGVAAPNKAVVITVDSTNTSTACIQSHTRITNANGFYRDTLDCTNGAISHLRVNTYNCNQSILVNHHQVPPSFKVVSNFMLSCSPATNNCEAVFNIGSGNALNNFVFNSAASHGSSAPDSIVRRRWKFGDGDTLGGNAVVTNHTYTQPGTYNVCLTIWTASGCEKNICKTVTVPPVINCKASFIKSISNLSVNVISTSTPSSGGVIYAYRWDFGDGSPIITNIVGTANHTFAAPGTYSIKHTIFSSSNTTAGGVCYDSAVQNVTISQPTNCNANFRDSMAGNKLYLYSTSQSSVPSSHYWTFGDGTSASNILNPVHIYNASGTYTVCLKIVTGNGCRDSICKVVTISSTLPQCHAVFNFAPAASNKKLILFNSSNASAPAGDQIVSRKWTFGDGTTLSGNVISPDHLYANEGVYNVCLRITTAAGCVREFCKQVEIRKPHCEAAFTISQLNATNAGYPVKFNNNTSFATQGDSIVERKWSFGNGQHASGNVDPTHVYTTAGSYNVCLVIRTASGCTDTTCKTIQVPVQGQVYCNPLFIFIPSANNNIQFNSTHSGVAPGDSIIKRHWNFGDGNTLSGNISNPLHHYNQPGVYNVCLRIITVRGCEKTLCLQVVTTTTAGNCVARFEAIRSVPRQVIFKSGMSWSGANNSIVERLWDFGDGSAILGGNTTSPTKSYLNEGIYTVCLKIKTANGCRSTWCAPVRVQDTLVNSTEPIAIRQLYPNPASVQLHTVVWSLHNNVNAEIAIYDIYGVKKWSINKVLLQGNNYTVLQVNGLAAGPYFLRVTTMYGVRSRQFYKL